MSSMSLSLNSLQQRTSPRDMLQSALTSGVETGSIKAEDQDALSSALDTIDSQIRSSRSTQSSGKPPSRDEMQAKVESLIDEQVESGDLTEEQASELKELFADVFAQGPGGAGGPPPGGGPGGAGGPPPGPPPGEEEEEDSTTVTSASSSASDAAKLLQDFMKQLLQQSGGTTYGTSGTTSSTGTATSALFDFSA